MQFFFIEFCKMLKHRGKILREVLDKYSAANGISMLALSKKVGYNASSSYRHFEKENLELHIIQRYGKAIGHDFRVEFPELDEEYGYILSEPQSPGYEPVTLLQALKQRDSWKEKYFSLLEKHNSLLMEKIEEKKE